MSRLFKASVSENKELIKNHYLLTLNPLKKIKKPEPGQFFMLSVDKGLDPLLKRPLSIHRLTGGNLQFLYRVVGSGTNILSEKKTGDILELIGPLGKGFPFKKTQKNIILVAGGLGIAPIFALAETLAKIPMSDLPAIPFSAATKSRVCRTMHYENSVRRRETKDRKKEMREESGEKERAMNIEKRRRGEKRRERINRRLNNSHFYEIKNVG